MAVGKIETMVYTNMCTYFIIITITTVITDRWPCRYTYNGYNYACTCICTCTCTCGVHVCSNSINLPLGGSIFIMWINPEHVHVGRLKKKHGYCSVGWYARMNVAKYLPLVLVISRGPIVPASDVDAIELKLINIINMIFICKMIHGWQQTMVNY